jgi:hypothetical protein
MEKRDSNGVYRGHTGLSLQVEKRTVRIHYCLRGKVKCKREALLGHRYVSLRVARDK